MNALKAGRWLLLRRLSQLGILLLFLIGPWWGIWWVKGTLASSYSFGFLPLTDPLLLLQSLLAGFTPAKQAWIGAAVVLVFYLLVGGRVFCSWVCPVNPLTDLAAWLRKRLGLKTGSNLSRQTRYAVLLTILLLAALTHTLAWEWINPVTGLQRGLLFGMGLGWLVLLAIFAYDLLVQRHGWCGHWCPVGAFYALLGRVALLRVSARLRNRCDDCMDCFQVCPEPQVIRFALKGQGSPVINSGECTNCGRCIEVCDEKVFRLTHRFNRQVD
ncbi:MULTISPECIES: quinol dehydrogenase ferredoxin subunit NapH [Chitinibacter]|uniref:quinol dehydrogenase ferredoxin subunit NapH n=1 Tax=Chitinibacter TaxID=230666 RepID=UPI00068DF1FE|nr:MULTISPECIES: quinol dehydrogenase ferredoxin subunit NapH [Chitinibacter]